MHNGWRTRARPVPSALIEEPRTSPHLRVLNPHSTAFRTASAAGNELLSASPPRHGRLHAVLIPPVQDLGKSKQVTQAARLRSRVSEDKFAEMVLSTTRRGHHPRSPGVEIPHSRATEKRLSTIEDMERRGGITAPAGVRVPRAGSERALARSLASEQLVDHATPWRAGRRGRAAGQRSFHIFGPPMARRKPSGGKTRLWTDLHRVPLVTSRIRLLPAVQRFNGRPLPCSRMLADESLTLALAKTQ